MEAVIGLVGVLVGGLITGLTQWQWEVRREDLAVVLSSANWETVEQAHMRIRHIDASSEDLRADASKDASFDEQDREIGRLTVEQISAGIDALRAVARLPAKGERSLTMYAIADRD